MTTRSHPHRRKPTALAALLTLACAAAVTLPTFAAKPAKETPAGKQSSEDKKTAQFEGPAPDSAWAPVIIPPADALPAFPGAEGAGSTTPGGRGGRVIYVTNLNDSGPGSFREACEADGPRNVLFKVSGVIALAKPIKITNPYITIAAQTAPGEGICIKNYPFETATHDAIIRYMRCRKGDEVTKADDSMTIGHTARDVIADHCSATWSIDECLSLSGDSNNITLQYCIIGEALRGSTHPKGNHAYGSLCRSSGPVSLHHNLYINNDARNPRFGDTYGKPPFPTFDFRNNIVYNFGKIASGVTQGQLHINYVNNMVIPGPTTDNPHVAPIHISPPSNISIYLSGNIYEKNDKPTASNALFISQTVIDGKEQVRAITKPFPMPPVKTQTAKEAYETVLANVGATLPVRDEVDARLVNQVRTRTGKMINSQKDVGGWPAYKTAPAPTDTANDGIPDDWRNAHNLAPGDGPKLTPDGYTNLEHYLNSIVQK